MITTTSRDFQRHFGHYQDEALKQPVCITKNGREKLVILSADEYKQLKRRARTVLHVSELPQVDYDMFSNVQIPEDDKQWNNEVIKE